MKQLLLSLLLIIASCTVVSAQDVTESEFRVSGNCGECKTRIEKAVAIKGVKFARWNKTTKMLKVAFRTDAVTVDSLQRRFAAVGHDTGAYKAPDAVYETLPACCLYRDNANTH
jgi:hypothetical protein